MKAKNTIILVIDGLRPKHLGCYGYFRNTSPSIDAFAENGVVFENAFVNSSWTKPNIVSTLTSLNPSTHKVLTIEDKISPKIRTLPEILKEQGYKTAIFSGLRHPAKVHGFRGFDKHRIFDDFAVQFRTADKINNEMTKWIEKNRKNNFFIYVHYIDTHLPFDPPAPFNTAFLKEPFKHKDPIGTKISKEGLEKIIPLYDSEILYFDSELKKFIEKLKEMHVLEDTLIIITSDHGMEFMEHGHFGFMKFLYEEGIHVPLILFGNELPKKKRIKQQVSMIDIMPSVLELMGIEFNGRKEGTSFVPLIERKRTIEKPVFMETIENSHEPYCSARLFQGIRTKKWKYIKTKQIFKFEIRPKMFRKTSYWKNNLIQMLKGIKNFISWGFKTEKEELYNLMIDPMEYKNISHHNPDIIIKMRKMFSEYFKEVI
ncbi:MAG: sulfatase [Candidatus Diapherotrites archaeon]